MYIDNQEEYDDLTEFLAINHVEHATPLRVAATHEGDLAMVEWTEAGGPLKADLVIKYPFPQYYSPDLPLEETTWGELRDSLEFRK